MPKKKWTEEQKKVAVARLTLGDKPVVIAKDLKIPCGTIRYWKANLKKIQEKDGTLGYHFEKRKNVVSKAWKIIESGLEQLEKALPDEDRAKDIAGVIKILYELIARTIPQEKPSAIPPIDWGQISTDKLRILIAEFERRQTALPPGEITIEGEVREISLE